MKPSIGTFHEGAAAVIDLPRLLETRMLIQANSGGGKSWAIRRLLEQTAGHVQQLVIDPEGEFSTLREKHDYVIAAPHDGDALAHPKTAQLLARRLLETGVSAILDIYDLKAHERQSFVRLFLEALVNAPKALWQPCLVVLDEAHVFCPEAGKAESAGAVIDLATRGRKRGFALIAATQRLAKLHKDTAAELLNKLVGRTGLDVDVKRAADELGMTPREAMENLRPLTAGEFFAFGPALSLTVQRLKVGPVQTTHPKAGDRNLRAPPKPTAAIKAVLPKLSDLPKEAEAEARSVEDLKRELANARRELTQAKNAKPGASREDLQAAEQRGFDRGKEAGALAAHRSNAGYFKTLKGSLHKAIDSALAEPPAPAVVVPAVLERPATRPTPSTRRPASNGHAEPQGDLTGPEQRILDAIAWLESLGIDPCEQTAVAFLANYTYGGGAFTNPRGRLNQRGLVEYVGDKIRLTEEGRALANAPTEALTSEELHARVLGRLPGPEQRLLKPLLEAYPDAMDGADVAAAANYTFGAGAFNNPRGRLRSLGLIEYVSGQLRAADALFPTR